MAKYDYFEALDSLALYASEVVKIACSENTSSKKHLEDIRANSSQKLLSLENSLFSDFLPPLERDSIAAYAHTLKALTDTACEHFTLCRTCLMKKKSEEEKLCISLVSEIKDATAILRNLKKPGETPDIQKFRDILHKAIQAHISELSKISSGAVPKSLTPVILSSGRLRAALSHCFDSLIEIMLYNI